ncbi:MAG: hypothetical protein ACXACF_06590 [Candidatus Hermodarchaeia archaeon]|jgi:hypothetical protein
MKLRVGTIVEIAGGVLAIGIGLMFIVAFDQFMVLGITFVLGGSVGAVHGLSRGFKDWYRERSRTKGKQEGALASYSTGYHRIDITDEGVQTKSLHIPYSSIRSCSFERSESSGLGGKTLWCIIKHVDSEGRIKETKLREEGFYGGLNVHTDIIRFSKKHGYRLEQQPSREIAYLAGQLRKLGVESQFAEPDVEHNRVSRSAGGDYCSWYMNFGGLKLEHCSIDEIKMSEGGKREKQSSAPYGAFSSYKFEFHYDFDCTVQIEPAPDIVCFGKPVKGFLGRVADYQWEDRKGIKLTLNEDAQVCKMLIEVKAPAIEIKGNHIVMRDKYRLSPKLFQAINIIAGHVKEACE